MKDYLQPAATLLVAIGLGFIALDQSRTTTARLNCAGIFGTPLAKEDALAKLGLPKEGNFENVRAYCRAFINPPEVNFPWTYDVNIENWPSKLD